MTVAPRVLIAEDDEGHATLIRRNLKRAGLGEHSVYLKDGQELLDYVYKQAQFSARQPSDAVAIIADLNMPRLNGFEVLQRLKSDVDLSRIPVYVMTTTDNPAEIERCYELGAAAYLVKPLDYGVFGEMVRRLAEFLSSIRLPAEERVVGRSHGP
jgi:CheY-like chemotaxis protein